MALFRRVDGVVLRFDVAGNPITDLGAPRPGPTIWEIGGPDGSTDPLGAPALPPPDVQTPVPPAPEPPPSPDVATLIIDVTNASTGGPFAGATVLTASTSTGNQTHTTDASGSTSLVVAVYEDIEVNVIAAGYLGVDQLVHIYDATVHRLGVALRPSSAAPPPAPAPPTSPGPLTPPGTGQPPGVPPQIVLQPGQIGELTPPLLAGAPDVAPGPYTRAAFETRGGVPSILTDGFSALDIGSALPGPVGIFATIISGILGLFKGSSGSADVSRLSTIVQNIGDLLLKTVSAVSDLAARSVHTDTQAAGLFGHLLGGVLGPIINALAAVIRGGSSDLGKLFGPITDSLKKIIGTVKHIYDAWLRPIIKAIDTARQLLRILETFHIKWAAEADAALGRLEGKISAPLLKTLQQLNKVSNTVNRIVTLDGTLQRITLLQSHEKHIACMHQLWWNSQVTRPGDYNKTALDPAPARQTPNETSAGIRAAVYDNTGEFAEQSDQVAALIRELVA